jgi:hypothetical protein
MITEMLKKVYGHHHPDHLKGAARSISFRPKPQTSARGLRCTEESLVDEREKRVLDRQSP